MKTKKIFSVILVVSMILASVSLSFAKENNFENNNCECESIKITNGYALAGRSNMKLTRGAIADFKIDTKVKCVTQKEIADLIKMNINNFSKEQYSNLTKDISFNYLGFGAKLFRGLFGIKFGQSIDYYKNARNKEVFANDVNGKNLLSAIHNLDEKEYRLTGNARAIGKSWIPSEPICFIEVTVIEFEDGKKIKVINTNSIVAESDGTRDSISGLNSKPLSLKPIN